MTDRRTRWDESLVFPEQWIADGYAYRKTKGFPRINVRLEAERFVNRALASGARYINWHRAWLNWLISPFCKGVPEAEAAQQSAIARYPGFSFADCCVIDLARKRIRANTTNDVLDRAVRAGIFTREQVREMGF